MFKSMPLQKVKTVCNCYDFCSTLKTYVSLIWIEKLRSPTAAKTWNELIVVIKLENTSETSVCIFVLFLGVMNKLRKK